MHDNLSNGNSYQILNVIDDYQREALVIEADVSLPTVRVIRTLNQLLEYYQTPNIIRCDNRPEFISREFKSWRNEHKIKIEYIQPGKLPLMNYFSTENYC